MAYKVQIQTKAAPVVLAIIGIVACSTPVWAQTSTPKADELLESGLALMDKALFKDANKKLQQAAMLYIEANKPIQAAHCYNHLSSNNRLMSNLSLARQQAHRALELLKGMTLDDPTERIRAYTNLGLLAAIRADYNQSLKLLKNASRMVDDPAVSSALQMVVLGSLGYLYDDLGKYDKAIFYYNRSLEILQAQTNPSKERLAKLYNNLGVAYANKGLFKKSRHYYRLELKINLAVKGKNHPDVAGTYLNLGSSYFRSGDVGEALIYFQQARRIIKNTYGRDHSMMVIALNSLAECQLELGHYQQAIDLLNNAVAIKKHLVGANHPELAISYNTIANAYSKTGNNRKAKKYFLKAVAIRKNNLPENHPDIATSYNAFAYFLISNKSPEKALEYLLNARKILLATVGSRHPKLAKTYASMAMAYAQLDKVVQSISFFQNALAITAPTFNSIIAKENPDPDKVIYPIQAISVLKTKAEALNLLYERKNNLSLLKASVYTYYALSKLLDRQQWGYNQLNSKLAIAKQSYKIYEQAIEATYKMYKASGNKTLFQLMFYFSEKSKGRVLLEAVAHTSDKKIASIPTDILEHEQQLNHALTQVKQALYGFTSTSELASNYSVTELKDSLFTLNRKLSTFARKLETKYPKYYRLKYNSDFPSVRRVKSRLEKQNTAIIEYFYGSSCLYAIVITPKQIRVEPLSFGPTLAKQIATFKQTIIDGGSDYIKLSQKLYKTLIKPIKPYIKTVESLLFVPGSSLRLFPFGALLTKKLSPSNKVAYTDLPYLINDYNISYATSVALNVATKKTDKEQYDLQFVGFAPIFGPENLNALNKTVSETTEQWERLSFSDYEVNTIASKFRTKHSLWDILSWGNTENAKLYISSEATESNFKNNGTVNARYIHLATHAFAANRQTQQTGIVFYQNDTTENGNILYANEIYNLQLHTQLVVLSACNTGIGTIIPGEGIMGLSRAFQYAGANNLIVSLWKVADRSTAELMISFYDNLRTEHSMPQALSRAKRTMIKNRRYAHPRYWSTFKLIGATALGTQ